MLQLQAYLISYQFNLRRHFDSSDLASEKIQEKKTTLFATTFKGKKMIFFLEQLGLVLQHLLLCNSVSCWFWLIYHLPF